ncbi:MAG: immunoglobulin-like domain-containing protein, partial [Candidatus Paceibacterota bacterium]
ASFTGLVAANNGTTYAIASSSLFGYTPLSAAIQTLGDNFHTGLTGSTQTLATSTADTNLGMTIVSNGTEHLFTPYWIGTLADDRIASAATWNAKQATISTAWPITLSGATVGFNGLSTSTDAVIGNIPYFSGANTFANVGTSTVSNGTGISISGTGAVVGSGLTITNTAPDQTVALANGAGINVTGTYPNFTVTNTGIVTISGTYPVIVSAGASHAVSLAFGTTTPNTWSQTQTFTTAPVLASFTGLVAANNGTTYAIASSSLFGYTPQTNQLAKGNFLVGNDAGVAQATSTIFISSTGNLGIGTSAPDYKLDVAGFINVNQYSGYRQDGLLLGYASTTNSSTIFGFSAGNTATTSPGPNLSLTAIGYKALTANTGIGNTAIGANALTANTSGTSNTAIGSSALLTNTTGSNSVAIGATAANYNNMTNGVAIGNTAGGAWSGPITTQGGVYIGLGAGLKSGNSSDYNTLIGYQAGREVSTGFGNILLGANVDTVSNLTSGGNNIGIGYNTFFPNATGNNQLNIGGIIFGTLPATSTALVSNPSGVIGIGTTTPQWNLQIASSTKTQFALSDMSAGANLKHWLFSSMGGNFYISTSSDSYATSTIPALSINSNGALTLASALGISSGGTGVSALPAYGQVLVGNAAGTGYDYVATSTFGGGGSATLSGSLGQIAYFSSANTAIGTSTLFISSASNVGIGTTSPYSLLSISNSRTTAANTPLFTIASTTDGTATSTFMTVLANGYVGIGTANPGAKLDVNGGVAYFGDGTASAPGISFHSGNNTGLYRYDDGTGSNLGLSANGGNVMYLQRGGNVGIGTTTPAWNLQVASRGKAQIALSDSGAGANLKHWLFSSMGGNLYIGTSSDAYATSTIPALAISSNGAVTLASALGISSGGTASSTPLGGILVGNGSSFIKSLVVGTGLSFDGSTLTGIEGTNYWTSSGSNLYNNVGTNLGIGTTSPLAILDVAGVNDGSAPLFQLSSVASFATTTQFIVKNDGTVGIGTATPGEKLEVVGNIISKGTSWTARTASVSNKWLGITYGNGLFVAVASSTSGVSTGVMTSPDGINWTTRTSAADKIWGSVTYGNGLFVAVSTDGFVMTSPNGATWTSRTAAAANNWKSVTYGNGTFVAVSSDGGANHVMTSPDGITWALQASAEDNSWQGITYGNGLFVAVALSGDNRVMTSPDGVTWTPQAGLGASGWWKSVTYGNGLFVAVSTDGGANVVMTSPNGTAWTGHAGATSNVWNSVTYGNGLYVAVSSDNFVMTSPDGATWKLRTSPADTWQGVAYGNGTFVAVANTASAVMTSGKADSNITPPNNLYQGGLAINGNLGVGTTSPFSLFSVGTAGNAFRIDTTGTVKEGIWNGTAISNVYGGTGLNSSALNGPISVANGTWQATTSIGVMYGGTGLTSLPSYGQLLLGNASSGYTLTATSSLGLLGSTTVSSLTTNYLPKWGGSTFNNSLIYDTGTYLGIGTTTPQWLFQLSTSTAPQFALGDSSLSSNKWTFRNAGGYLYIATSSPLTFATSSMSALTIDPNGYLGVSTTSPYALLSVSGLIAGANFNADNATATSTFAGGLSVNGGAFVSDFSTGETSISSLISGTQSFDTNAGMVQWTDVPIDTVVAGVPQSYTAYLGGNPMIMVYGLSDGASSTYSNGVTIGSSTPPTAMFNVFGRSSTSSTTVEFANSASTTLFKLQDNGLAGFGTTSPWGLLSINGNALGAGTPQFVVGSSTATNFIVTNGGNVGIGTTSPGSLLSIGGTGTGWNFFDNATTTSYAKGIDLMNGGCFSINGTCVGGGAGGNVIDTLASTLGAGNDAGGLNMVNLGLVGIGTTSPYSLLSISNSRTTAANTPLFTIASTTDGTATSTFMTVLANGNIGIGTSAPAAKLSIQGTNTEATLGTEKVTNGSFNTNDTGWTVGAGWSYDGVNDWEVHTPGNIATLEQDVSAVAGETYVITFYIETLNGTGTVTCSLGGTDCQNSYSIVDGGYVYEVVTAQTTDNLIFTPSTDFDGYIDAISVKKLTQTSPVFTLLNSDGTTGFEMRSSGADTLGWNTNIFIGANAGMSNMPDGGTVAGLFNTAVGAGAFESNTTGSSNSAFGGMALEYSNGNANSAFGMMSLGVNTVGSYNSAFGGSSLGSNSTGSYNNAFGTGDTAGALGSNTTGSYNNAFGSDALLSNTIGSYNSAFGGNALNLNTTGENNSAFGFLALPNNTTGQVNTAFGAGSLFNNQTGSYNVALGMSAGFSALGSGNVFIGNEAGYFETGSNKFYLANSSTTPLIYGDFATGRIGLGSTTPGSLLSISNSRTTAANTPLFTIASTTNGTATSTFMTVLANGNVGIGTTSPAESLSTSGRLYVGGTGTSTIENNLHVMGTLKVGTGSLYLTGTGISSTDGSLGLSSGTATSTFANGLTIGTNKFVVQQTSGNVGIGTADPLSPLHVVGDLGTGNMPTAQGAFLGIISSYAGMQLYGSSGGLIDFNDASGEDADFRIWEHSGRFSMGNGTSGEDITILSSGYVGVGTSSPMSRLSIASSVGAQLTLAYDTTNYANFTVNSLGGLTIAPSVTNATTTIGGGDQAMVIDSLGNVGIGTTSPYARLSVVSSVTDNSDAFVISTTTSGAIFRVTGYGDVRADGSIYSPVALQSGSADYAEYFYTDDIDLKSGEAVCVDTSQKNAVKRCDRAADNNLMGIVSTKPGFIGNAKEEYKNNPNYKLIAMLGQIPAFVSAENGPIISGDSLTAASSTPGYVMRADPGDPTVGVALEPLAEGEGKINVLISRRNKSLVVEQVESMVADRVANMKIEDQVQAMVKQSIDKLSLDAFNVSGAVSANEFIVPVRGDISSLLGGFASTTSPDVLTADGNGVDIYKLATYTLSGVYDLAAKVDAHEMRLTSLEARVSALENGEVSTASDSPVTFSTSTLASAFNAFGVFISNGIAQFGTLIADRFVAATNSEGSSSAGTVNILAGNTVAQVENAYVKPTTKIFVTLTASTTGSWFISDKKEGSFKLVLSAPQESDVSFDYFLVQTEGQVATSTPPEISNSQFSISNERDTTPPVITLLGDNPVRLSVGDTFTDPGVTVVDDIDNNPSVTTYINGVQQEVSTATIDTASPTTYLITYEAKDAAGNSSTAMRSVIVGASDSGAGGSQTDSDNQGSIPLQLDQTLNPDTVSPVVTLNGDAAMQITVGDVFTDPGATAADDTDGSIMPIVTGTVDTSTAGLYTLTYTATDAAGNIGTASRLITVIHGETVEPTAPAAPPPVPTSEVGTPTESVGADVVPADTSATT